MSMLQKIIDVVQTIGLLNKPDCSQDVIDWIDSKVTNSSNEGTLNNIAVFSASSKDIKDGGMPITDVATKEYVNGLINGIPLANYVTLATSQTISGVKTFNAIPSTPVAPTATTHLTNKTYVDTQLNLKLDKTQKGVINGLAELGSDGKVPTLQLPSYVDDVVEYPSKANFPAIGESGKIYVDLTSNLTWRWSGTIYVEISPSLALGETSATAYRGDRGATAYDTALTAVQTGTIGGVAIPKSGTQLILPAYPVVPTKVSQLTNDSNYISDTAYVHTDNNYTTNDKSKLDGIAIGAEVNIQSDWNITDIANDAYIKNKPVVPSTVPDATTTVKGIALLGATGGSARFGQKSDVGLSLVDNTSDTSKPVSNATQTALNLKANTAAVVTLATSQTISGAKTFNAIPSTSVAPTATTHLANKTYVDTALNLKANTADVVTLATSQTISGAKTFSAIPSTPVAPTATTHLTNKTYVDNLIASLNNNYETSTSNIMMDGAVSVGSTDTVARGNHRHPTDTSREAVSNKTTAISATPDNTLYPTEAAVKTYVDDKTNGFITTETDPTVPNYVKAITINDISSWNTKQNTSDNNLTTTNKSIVGAINEVNAKPIGSGNVIGAVSSTDNAIVRWDGTTGKTIQNSAAICDDAGNMQIGSRLTFSTGGTTYMYSDYAGHLILNTQYGLEVQNGRIWLMNLPNSPEHATNKEYVDTALNLKANTADVVTLATSQTISGAKTFSTIPSTSIAPTATAHLTNKTYVDGQIASRAADSNVVHLTGNEVIGGNKQFIYNVYFGSGTVPNSNYISGDNTDLFLAAVTNIRINVPSNGNIIASKDPTTDMGVATKRYVDGQTIDYTVYEPILNGSTNMVQVVQNVKNIKLFFYNPYPLLNIGGTLWINGVSYEVDSFLRNVGLMGLNTGATVMMRADTTAQKVWVL